MKPKKSKKKLILSKMTIANLNSMNNTEMKGIVGGEDLTGITCKIIKKILKPRELGSRSCPYEDPACGPFPRYDETYVVNSLCKGTGLPA